MGEYKGFLFFIVVLSFSLIHFIEILSFLARLAGALNNRKALGYALQNAVFMMTRFFSMLLLPILGLIIDLGTNKNFYLIMVSASLFFALIFSLLAILFKARFVSCFAEIIGKVESGKGLFTQFLRIPFVLFNFESYQLERLRLKDILNNRIFFYSVFVFCIYSVSIFISFYFGLVFPEYRTSISHLSAVTNAFATVLLTFYIEPKISISIDNGWNVEENIMALLWGRIIGVGFLSQAVIFTFWVVG